MNTHLISASLLLLAALSAQAQAPQQTIVVLGQVTPIAQGESSRTVTIQDAQQHPLAYTQPEDYLRNDSSVDILQYAPAGIMSDISIRGSSFEQTLILVNGLRIDDSETSHFNLDLPIPQPALGTISVLHGAGSTLYGSDAIGGVVDFSTFVPTGDSLHLRAGYGSFDTNQQAFLGTLARKRWNEVLSASRDFSEGFLTDRDYRTESASTETRAQSALGTTDILLAANDRAYGANDFYGLYNSWERTKSWFAALTQGFTPHTQAAIAYRRHSDIYVLLRDDPSYYKNQHIDDGIEASLRDTRPISRNITLLSGLEEITEQIRSTNLGIHGRNRGAGYATAEWRIPQRASLSAGLREEIFSGGRIVSSPTASGTLWLPHALKLHGSLGYGFREGTFLDLYYSDPTHKGNSHLKPESAWNYELGLDWYGSSRLSASTTAFTSTQHNAIDYTRSSSTSIWTATNLGALRFTGIESSLNYRANAHQQINLSYTWLHGTQSALNGLTSEYVFTYPVHNARLNWTWQLPHAITAVTRMALTDRYAGIQLPTQRNPYPTLDASILRETGRIRPYLQMTNLTNTGYEELAGVRMPSRAFTGGIEIVLNKNK